ncbi:MAG: methyltransferase [Bryobacteraceae bacterium]
MKSFNCGCDGSRDDRSAELFRPATRRTRPLHIKSVLPDWPDREATAILKRCAEAARPSGRVVVFTGAGPGEDASPALLMMILVGGRERTLDEFREMSHEAGLDVRAVGR